MKCQRLVQTVVDRFTTKDPVKVNASKIKSIALLRVSHFFCFEIVCLYAFYSCDEFIWLYKSNSVALAFDRSILTLVPLFFYFSP